MGILEILTQWSGVMVLVVGIIILVVLFLIKTHIVDTLNAGHATDIEKKGKIIDQAIDIANRLYLTGNGASYRADNADEVFDLYTSLLAVSMNPNLATNFAELVNEASNGSLSDKTYTVFLGNCRRELGLRGTLNSKKLHVLDASQGGRAGQGERPRPEIKEENSDDVQTFDVNDFEQSMPAQEFEPLMPPAQEAFSPPPRPAPAPAPVATAAPAPAPAPLVPPRPAAPQQMRPPAGLPPKLPPRPAARTLTAPSAPPRPAPQQNPAYQQAGEFGQADDDIFTN